MLKSILRGRWNKSRKKISRTLDSFELFYLNYVTWVLSVSASWTDELISLLPGRAQARVERGQSGAILNVVVVAIVAIIGLLVYSEVNSQISVTGSLADTQTNLSDGVGDAFELVPIVLIVLVAGLVIGVISQFR